MGISLRQTFGLQGSAMSTANELERNKCHGSAQKSDVSKKVFEQIVLKHVFNHLREPHFLTPVHPRFVPDHSTVNQLTYIYNTLCKALDDSQDVRALFFISARSLIKTDKGVC